MRRDPDKSNVTTIDEVNSRNAQTRKNAFLLSSVRIWENFTCSLHKSKQALKMTGLVTSSLTIVALLLNQTIIKGVWSK